MVRLQKVLAVAKAMLIIVSKWLIGVLIQKVIADSTGISIDSSSSGLYNFVFLNQLDFAAVAVLSASAAAILSFVGSSLSSLALLRGAQVGRKMRNQVLRHAVGSESECLFGVYMYHPYRKRE